MKQLIQCPSCEQQGRRQILGEIDNQGHFIVLRFHKGTTRIVGDSFTVFCDLCTEPIYIKKGGTSGTVSSYRESRVFRVTSLQTSGTVRA